MPQSHELYLIRHGLAEERGNAWPDDTKRPLTSKGIASLRKGARALERLGVAFDIVLTSPLVRSRQTAEVVADAFNPRPSIVAIESLAPGAGHQSLFEDLAKHARLRRIVLVGHEPDIGALAAHLAGVRQPLEFKKGAIVRIDVDALPPDGPGLIRWFLTPKILRRLRR